MTTGGRQPQNYWAILIALAGLALSGFALIGQTGKADRDDVRQSERRLCQLEMRQFGRCER